jgi:large subunit ribosomal protein L18
MKAKKILLREKRHRTIRLRLCGSLERPRLVVRRSLRHLEAQLVDDLNHCTLFCLSSAQKENKAKIASGGSLRGAEVFGGIFAAKAKEKGIKKIIFDRAGYLYHGRVKAFAEALRKQGLEF